MTGLQLEVLNPEEANRHVKELKLEATLQVGLEHKTG